MKTIRVRRAGIHEPTKSDRTPVIFRKWLYKQPRKELTYPKKFSHEEVTDKDGIGWTTQNFVMEAIARGVPLSWGTVLAWAEGSQPKPITRSAITRAFPRIEF